MTDVLEITAQVGHQVAIGDRLGRLEIEDTSELVAVAYLLIKDGKQIKKGQEVRVSPSSVERERYGGIIGEVESWSDFPVSIDGATHQIGDEDLARNLLGGEARIEVVVRLHRDSATSTGFEWTSGTGPEDILINAGTTAEVRVTIEQRAPITLVLPFLKSLLGQ